MTQFFSISATILGQPVPDAFPPSLPDPLFVFPSRTFARWRRALPLLLALATSGAVLAQEGRAPAQAGGVAVANAATGADAFYEGLGGKAGIDRLVAQFLQIVLQDPRISEQFREIDQPRLKEKLAEQFCQLSGGPCQYSGKSMELIHEGMHITQAHFNALAEDLQLAMEQQSIASRIQNKLVARLAPMSRAIIGK